VIGNAIFSEILINRPNIWNRETVTACTIRALLSIAIGKWTEAFPVRINAQLTLRMDTLLHMKTAARRFKCSVELYINWLLKSAFTSQHVLTQSYVTCLNVF